MDNLISRQAAIDAIHSTIFDFFGIVEDDSDSPMTESDKRLLELNKAITTAIRRQKAIDPVKHGKWIAKRDGWNGGFVVCSECFAENGLNSKYCPNCGARNG